MTLSEMKKLLAEHDIRLSKRLGQNFLHDINQLRKIVLSAKLTPGDRVIEIGPGIGPLTELLVKNSRLVLAIEKDEKLFEILQKRFVGVNNLKIINDDALIYFLSRNQDDWSDWIVVSNLPYSVASPILVEFSKCAFPPKIVVATVQLEVANRIIASPSQPEYGLLTLFIQLRYEPCGYFKIPASCFFPEPKVDSACITLVKRKEDLLTITERELFYKVVNRAFNQRRKMMLKLLKSDFPVNLLKRAFLESGIGYEARGESVSLEQFVGLTKFLFSNLNRG